MEKNNLKNIVVLKDLPSNIVDEAIVILKPSSKIKKLEILDKNKDSKSIIKETESNKHVIKEAEMLVSKYISKIEKKENKVKHNSNINKKYKRLKKYSVVSSIALIISVICNFVFI